MKVLFNSELLLFAGKEIMNILLSAGKIWHCCRGGMICVEAMINDDSKAVHWLEKQ
jgi:hypothetical protein